MRREGSHEEERVMSSLHGFLVLFHSMTVHFHLVFNMNEFDFYWILIRD